MNDENPQRLEAIAASSLVSAAVLASLIVELAGKGILSDAEVREIYDQALLMIEKQQANSDGSGFGDIYEPARKIIEDQLRSL